MYITYDEQADVLYAKFGERTPQMRGSRDFGSGRFVEYNANEEPVAVEFLDASHGVDLQDIPRSGELRAAFERLGGLLAGKIRSAA